MRITNTMMTNNTMRNVNKSKTNLYNTEEQMSTQKKISKPSDDPIIAIRALSLRTSLTEITQYLKKNIPDARSWMKLTETSLDNVSGSLSDIVKYCDQGSNDSFTLDDRYAIIDAINQLKESIYQEGNADYAGRYLFTGYRTDTALTFLNSFETDGKKYEIKESFTFEDLSSVKYMKNEVDITDPAAFAKIAAADRPETVDVYRVRLGYMQCTDEAPTVEVDGNAYPADKVKSVTADELKEIISTTGLEDDTAYYVYDMGEVAFSTTTYQKMVADESSINVSYTKDNFKKGDIRPENYFNCTDISDAANPVEYKHNSKEQTIEYTINFSQTIKVNTQASDVISQNIGRDLDDLNNSLAMLGEAENKLKKLKEYKETGLYDEDIMDSMIEAVEKEIDYAKDNMKKLFGNGITKMGEYESVISNELSDLGSREVRLTLAESRLTQQQTTFKDLKSSNEDVDLEEIAIEFAAAETVYDAAIATASKTVRQTLLDYL